MASYTSCIIEAVLCSADGSSGNPHNAATPTTLQKTFDSRIGAKLLVRARPGFQCTMVTGQGEWCATWVLTLPSNRRANTERPRDPMIMRSKACSLA